MDNLPLERKKSNMTAPQKENEYPSYVSDSRYTEGRSSIGASTTGNLKNATLKALARSDRDAEDFVRYLLEGSGAEDKVDFAALRTELENMPSSLSDSKSFSRQAQSTASPIASTRGDNNISALKLH